MHATSSIPTVSVFLNSTQQHTHTCTQTHTLCSRWRSHHLENSHLGQADLTWGPLLFPPEDKRAHTRAHCDKSLHADVHVCRGRASAAAFQRGRKKVGREGARCSSWKRCNSHMKNMRGASLTCFFSALHTEMVNGERRSSRFIGGGLCVWELDRLFMSGQQHEVLWESLLTILSLSTRCSPPLTPPCRDYTHLDAHTRPPHPSSR